MQHNFYATKTITPSLAEVMDTQRQPAIGFWNFCTWHCLEKLLLAIWAHQKQWDLLSRNAFDFTKQELSTQ
jgi:hypothetical protein